MGKTTLATQAPGALLLAFERGYKVIVPAGANSTFDNDYMTGEVTYKYYNDMMWPERFATCISVEEAVKLLER